ncbi:MAG: glycine--tRNA ligase subunit beta [Brevundimonas sp.]|uniref:glycine--tRNA ligase subunit beta n=1 Tax=Brevundimonas sp. TaxID=1871086 RepID=UPI00391D1491
MPQLLLEIFSEEIPARMQAGGARDLERLVGDRLKAEGLTWDALTTFAGPRRLTLVIEGLPAATPDRDEELKGPKASAPPQALEGFLRKTGLTREQLEERDGVLYARIQEKGRRTKDVVHDALFETINNFPWPKSMRWGDGHLRWVRPIKRILCLFDGEVVPFSLASGSVSLESSDITEGHRFLGSGRPLKIRDFADYRRQLQDNYVMLDVADRKLRILEQARAVCAAKGLALVDDDGLLDEVAGLAEWPTPILGDMDPQFLDLPPEVVRLSMKVHQKYFAVRDPARDGLAPHFVVVANVEATDGGKALAAGNSRVLSARLNDARFFWDEDRKVGFDAWLEKLKGVTFHARLGTLAERVDRIAALAREIAPLVGADPDQAEQAARLAKADLASGMVGEFPELQGVMGGYYARADHGDAMADAIRDHYKPQGPGDTVPTAPLTVAVALADKLDTLVGFFAIDEKPTGSKDPFALRRAALGVIRLVLENSLRLPLEDICEFAMRYAGGERPVAIAEWTKTAINNDAGRKMNSEIEVGYEVVAFFADRLKVLLRDQGQRHDLVDAVFALGDDDLVRIVRRVEALGAFLATDDGANLLAGYKRASNILKAEAKKGDVPTGMVQTGLPNQPEEETALAFAVGAAGTAVDAALETEDFAAAMTALSKLRSPVDAFFDKVMVNSDVAAERDNRLKLLGQVRDVMGRVADFGQVTG